MKVMDLLTLVVACGVLPLTVNGAEKEFREVWNDVPKNHQRAFLAINEDIASGQRKRLGEMRQSVDKNVVALTAFVATGNNSKALERSLLQSAQLLDRINSADLPPAKRESMYKDLYEDLAIKANYANSDNRGNVKVTAFTKDVEGEEVGGYEVWYVLKGWEDDENRSERFDKFSSPTTMDMSSGSYLMWTKKSNGPAGKRVPVKPGKDMKTTKKVDLPIP